MNPFRIFRKKPLAPRLHPGQCLGIPRGMMYYHFFPLWKAFWERMGFQILVSPVSSPEIAEAGLGLTGTDLCLPVKTYLGHVLWLREKVDVLFLPRLVSIEPGAYLCPKILGLNDVIRNVIPDLPPLLGPMVNYKGPRRVTLEESFLSLAGDVGLPVRQIKEAYQEAFDLWQRHQEELGKARGIPRDLIPEDLARDLDRPGAEAPRFRLGVIGRPYLLFDPVLSHRLIKKLVSFSSELTFYQGIPAAEREAQAERLSKPVYWSLGRDLVAASVSFSQWERIDGLINVSSFACGQDAFTSYLIDHYARLGSEKPVLSLVLDEHTSAVGLQTRLEAYFDLLETRALQGKTIPCN